MYRPKKKKLWIYPVTPQWDIMALPWNMRVMLSSDPSSVTSESTGDSDDSYGSSVEVSDTEEEIESDGDDGNFSSDTWTFVDDDCAADDLLNRYPFRPPGVAGRPRNCIPPESKPEEYVYMFLGVFLQELVDGTNIW